MHPFTKNNKEGLSADDKAAAINLAFLLDLAEYDTNVLKVVSKIFTEKEKRTIYDFWKNLSPVTSRAWLCMADFERRL